MNFFVFPREIREINKREDQIKLWGLSINHEKINAPPPFILNLRVVDRNNFCLRCYTDWFHFVPEIDVKVYYPVDFLFSRVRFCLLDTDRNHSEK